MRIDDLLKQARLQLGGKFSAALDARLLLQEATGLTHAEIIAAPELELNAGSLLKFNALLARRLQHEPISRILGHREFYGRRFAITPDVLDPRPDTETLVELALRHFPGPARFVDLGTGSGAIAITLCAENPNLSGLAIDLSAAALAVAEQNAKALGVDVALHFRQGRWFEGLEGQFDLIISNPPYIRQDAELMPDVSAFDPALALFGGEDGLEAYRAIAAGAAAHLAPAGQVMVEIGAGQAEDVTLIFSGQGFHQVEQAADLAGHPRALAFARH
ncbi:MAG: peptide chain release factor N(5)-glutamine methyltransferase [Alphaproteobacteria bacterium]|nr:peptide chain release factor N(5)-glutamine methyltransferase [Alphaproteobacteria bacterium]